SATSYTGTNDVVVTVDVPGDGIAEWIDTKTGAIVGSQVVTAGNTQLAVPAFVIDIVLRVVPVN
ncbi:MAG: hypothetical protein HRU15_13980, partial [Planctomycetes bacterium]|nr:hypothetical protein [Planctomycetota bacterium]